MVSRDTAAAADFALVVGIDHYPRFRSLKGAIVDATSFADWLVHDAGGALPPENCVTLLSEVTKRGRSLPGQDDIDYELNELITRARDAGGGRRFYLYFSGHGLSPTSDDVILCLGDWSDDFRNKALSVQAYVRYLVDTGLFGEVVVFLDCCRLWEANVAGLGPSLGQPMADEGAARVRTLIARATEYNRRAYETRTGGDDDVRRGFFTRALIGGLRGGAAQPPQGVPISALIRHLELETPRLAAEGGKRQRPHIASDFSVVDEPVLGYAPPPPRELESGHSSSPLHALRLAGPSEDIEVAALDAGGRVMLRGWGQVQGMVPAGDYTLRSERGGALFEQACEHRGPSRVLLGAPPLLDAVAPLMGSQPLLAAAVTRLTSQGAPRPLGPGPHDAELLIAAPHADSLLGLSLLDAAGLELPVERESQPASSATAIVATLAPGAYFLRTGDRECPLHLYTGWQTRVFPGTGGLADMAVLMARPGERFDAEDAQAVALDTALAGLMAGRCDLAPSVRWLLRSGAISDPLLGMVGGLALLMDGGLDARCAERLCARLDALTPGSPDVYALRVACARRLNTPAPTEPITRVPMLQLGLIAVLKQRAEAESGATGDDPLERAALALLGDSVWSTWTPTAEGAYHANVMEHVTAPDAGWGDAAGGWGADISTHGTSGYSSPPPGSDDGSGWGGAPPDGDQGWGVPSEALGQEVIPAWLDAAVRDAMEAAAAAGHGLDVRALASRLGVSEALVRRAYARLLQPIG